MNFSFENFGTRLLHSEVGHLNIQSMEVNSLQTLSDVTCKVWFTNPLDPSLVRNGAGLMELSEQIIEVDDGSCVV